MISTSNAWNHNSLLARTQARLTTYCAGLCFKSLASKFFFFYGEQVPSLNPKDSSFVTVTKTKGHYQSFASVCLMTRYLMKLVFRPLFHIARTYVTRFLTLPLSNKDNKLNKLLTEANKTPYLSSSRLRNPRLPLSTLPL